MYLVNTTGPFQLVSYFTGDLIRHEGFTVVPRDPFVEQAIKEGKLTLVASLTQKATDAELLKYMAESKDTEFVRDSFVSKYSETPVPGVENPPLDDPKKPKK